MKAIFKKISTSQLFSRLIMIGVIAFVGALFYSNDTYAAKPDVTASEVNEFCSTETEWGFYERMFLVNGSGVSLDESSAINVPVGAKSIPVKFKIDVWFCKKRVEISKYPLATCKYGIIKEARVNTYTIQDCTKSWSPAANNLLSNIKTTSEMHNPSSPNKTSPSGTPHYRMNTQIHTATLNVSSLNQGNNRLCFAHSFTSMDPKGYYVYGKPRCVTIKINFGWNLTVGSQNRVKKSSGAAYSSYGNYREGSNAPRTVTPGSTVQWRHEVRNTDKGTATYERWRDRKGINSSSYLLVGAHDKNQKLAGGKNVYVPSNSTYNITNADVGKTICERYVVQGRSSANNNRLGSAGSCVRVVTDWSLTGTTTIKVNGTTRSGTPNVAPGDTINWTNVLRNNGPQSTHRSVKVGTLVQDYAIGGGLTSSNVVSSTTIAAGFASGSTRTYQNGNAGNGFTYLVKASDVGKRLCRRLQWDPTRWNDTNTALSYSTQRCVSIPYDFNLRPIIVSPPNNLTPGQPIPPIEPKVNNDGPTRSAPGIQWELTRFELSPGTTKPVNTQNGTTPCGYFGNGCVVKDSGTQTFPDGSTALNSLTGETVNDNMPVGSKVCFGLSVQPYSDNSSNWRHYSVCITVNKHPSIQVWGGDLRAGGTIDTSVSRGVDDSNATASFGSWVEYGVFSKGVNDGLSSGSYLVDGDTGSNVAMRNKLTFANRGGSYGNYNFDTTYDIATQFTPSATAINAGSSLTIGGGTASGTYQQTGTSLSVRGTVAQGRHIIIYAPTATVTITDDLNYGGSPYSSLSQIPQLVIVADKIRIQRDVENVNAWLLARDYIDTCSNVGTAGVMPASGVLSSTVCDKRLNINGPVSTERLILKRTAGGDTGSYGEPAEVFNLRPDAYLWRYFDAAAEGQVRVISVKELPPRF